MTDTKQTAFGVLAARFISLCLAAFVVCLVLFFPRLIAPDGAQVPFGSLVLSLLGMSLAWVHGFGFRTGRRLVDCFLSAWIAWPLIAVGLWGIIRI